MFRVKWDKEINGVILCQSSEDALNVSPRPVFKEELDILGFDKYWKYPKKTENPLLWALGRRYFYKGVCVAEAKGGNIFEAPEIIIKEEGKGLKLKPINIKKVIEKNKSALFVLENEAIDFVLNTYKKYKDKVDYVAVAFSGGKDSQVVLDIVSRVLHPDDYIVVFSDTTMELPPTYETVERTIKEYQERYPNLKFYTVKPPKPAIEFWEDFGPPSRIHRWCCTVTKTAPFVNFIRELHYGNGGTKPPKILVFDGVRAEESTARSGYSRVRLNIKYLKQINVEPLQNWSLTEIFLYSFYRNIKLNSFYKFGVERIGCSICPFSSFKSEFLINKVFSDFIKNFLNIIKKMAINRLKDKTKIHKYISEGQWKKRAGGRDITIENFVFSNYFTNRVEIICRNFDLNKFKKFLKIIGDFVHYTDDNSENISLFEIRKNNENIALKVRKNKDGAVIEINNTISEVKEIEKIINKSVYCVNCRSCEIFCANNNKLGLQIINDCNHCLKCLDIEKGCYVAKSLWINQNNEEILNRSKTMGRIANNRYQTFGLIEEWFHIFLSQTNDFMEDIKKAYEYIKKKNNKSFDGKTGLGLYQVISMSVWLRESGFLNEKKELIENFTLFKDIYLRDRKLIWEIILTNLYFNSLIFRWYLDTFRWQTIISKNEIKQKLVEDDSLSKLRTITNDINSLYKTLVLSPLGNKLGLAEIVDKRKEVIRKAGTSDISLGGIYYNLFKTSQILGGKHFRLFQFYNFSFMGGPYKIFGIDREQLMEKLNAIQTISSELLRVEFNADLDNVHMGSLGLEGLKKLTK